MAYLDLDLSVEFIENTDMVPEIDLQVYNVTDIIL